MDDFDHHEPSLSERLERPYPQAYQQSPPASFPQVISPVASFPQVIFENKMAQQKPIMTQPQSQQVYPVQVQQQAPVHRRLEKDLEPEEEEDEEDLNIERIKSLLQATKQEIEKMNTNHVGMYNSSFKNDYGVEEKENKYEDKYESKFENRYENKYETMESKSYQNNGYGFKPDYTIDKKPNVARSDVTVTVKQPFNPLLENQRRILGDVSNKKENYEDEDIDIPAPQSLGVKKHIGNYQPKVSEDNTFSIRSFRRNK